MSVIQDLNVIRRRNKRREPLDEALFVEIFADDDQMQQLRILAKVSRDEDEKRDIDAPISRREMSEQLLREDLLPESISRLKWEAKKNRKARKSARNSRVRMERSYNRSSRDVFSEPSVGQFNVSKKKAELRYGLIEEEKKEDRNYSRERRERQRKKKNKKKKVGAQKTAAKQSVRRRKNARRQQRKVEQRGSLTDVSTQSCVKPYNFVGESDYSSDDEYKIRDETIPPISTESGFAPGRGDDGLIVLDESKNDDDLDFGPFLFKKSGIGRLKPNFVIYNDNGKPVENPFIYYDPETRTIKIEEVDVVTESGYTLIDDEISEFEDISGWDFSPEISLWETIVNTIEESGSRDVGILTSFATLFYQLIRSRSYMDVAAAVYQFSYAHSDSIKNIRAYVGNFLQDHWKNIVSLFSKVNVPDDQDDFIAKVSTESGIEILKDFHYLLDVVLTSDLANALGDLLLSIVSMRWFPSGISHGVTRLFGKQKKMPLVRLMSIVLTAVTTVLEYGMEIITGKSIRDVITSRDPFEEGLSLSRTLISRRNYLYDGLPVEGHHCRKQYSQDVGDTVLLIEQLVKKIRPLDSRKKDLELSLIQLQQIQAYLANSDKHHERLPPLVVLVSGPPGIGKSKLIPWVLSIWSKVKGRKHSPSLTVTRDQKSEFWENYNPNSHPYLFYAELGNDSLPVALTSNQTSLAEIQRLCDTNPYPCNTAFDNKGDVYAKFELIVIDTNNKNLHIKELMHAPAAMYRRFLYVDVSVKSKFKSADGTSLDYEASMRYHDENKDDELLDRYNIEISRREPIGNSSYKTVVEGRGDIFVATQVLKRIYTEHISRNERLSNIDLYSFIGFCFDEQEEKSEEEKEQIDEIVSSIDLNLYDPDDVVFWEMEEEITTQSGIMGNFYRPDLPVLSNLSVDYVSFRDYLDTFGFILHSLIMCVFFATFPYLHRVYNGTWFSFSWTRLIIFLMLIFCFVYIPYFSVTIMSFSVFLKPYAIFNEYLTLVKNAAISDIKAKRDFYWDRFLYHSGMRETYNPFRKCNTAKTLLFLTPVIGLLGVYMYSRKKEIEVRSEAHTKFVEPSSLDDKINEYEEKSDCVEHGRVRVATKFFEGYNTILPMQRAVHKGSPEELYRAIRKNIYDVKIDDGTASQRRTTQILGLCSSYAIINTHAMGPYRRFALYVPSGSSFFKVDIYPTDIVSEGDLSLINVKKRSFKNILHHFINGRIESPLEAWFNDQSVKTSYFKDVLHMKNEDFGQISIGEYFTYPISHYSGLCGHPLVARVTSHSSAIVGIHIAGHDKQNTGYAMRVTYDDLDFLRATLASHSPTIPVISQSGLDMRMEVPLPKSPFVHEPYPFVDYYGKVPGKVMANKKSRLVKTRLEPFLGEFFSQFLDFERNEVYDKPMMKPRFVDGEWCSPVNRWLMKLSNDSPTLDPWILERCITELSDHIISGLRDRGVNKLAPLTSACAINGVINDVYTRRINCSTAAGFGLPGTKGEYLPIVDNLVPTFENEFADDFEVRREMTPKIRRLLSQMFVAYQKYESANSVFNIVEKDEPRLAEKARDGRTRMFAADSMVMLIFCRMFLSPFYTLMVEHSDIFCAALGVRIHTEAEELVKRLTDFSPFLGEGDYSGFDCSNTPEIALAASTVVVNVLKAMGYNDFALSMAQAVLADGANPLMCVMGDLLRKMGMQPSGKYATAEDNSLRGLLLLMYAFYANEDLKHLSFFECIKPLVYGDDLLLAIKEHVLPFFNNNTYQRDCKRLFGMKFTSASKSFDMTDYMNIHEVSFLRRKFVFSDNLGKWIAQLDLNSLYKSLEWSIPSSELPEDLQMVACTTSALWEFFFHARDRNHFVGMREYLLEKICLLYQGDRKDYNRRLPTYDRIYDAVMA